ncbi:hypothetical protein Tco_0856029, partial [Tanacetum coccineum]
GHQVLIRIICPSVTTRSSTPKKGATSVIPGLSFYTTDVVIPPQSFSNIDTTQGSSYIHDGNLSHEVGGVSGKAPSIGDMARGNMSSGSVHSFTRDKSAPSWNALNKRDPSLLMIESDKVQEFPSDEFEPMMTESDNMQESVVQFSLVRMILTTDN